MSCRRRRRSTSSRGTCSASKRRGVAVGGGKGRCQRDVREMSAAVAVLLVWGVEQSAGRDRGLVCRRLWEQTGGWDGWASAACLGAGLRTRLVSERGVCDARGFESGQERLVAGLPWGPDLLRLRCCRRAVGGAGGGRN